MCSGLNMPHFDRNNQKMSQRLRDKIEAVLRHIA